MMKATIMCSVFFVGACVADEAGQNPELEAQPRLAANALLPSQLLNTALIPDVLDQTNLDEMSSTADGRATLTYVIGCALPASVTLIGNYVDDFGSPGTVTYRGAMGLASSWTTSALTTAQQRFVTGCALATTNNAGTSITVSLRGPASALATTSTEVANYTLQEGAFFGNAFVGGEGVAACKGSGTSTLSGRVCANPGSSGRTVCGYFYAGTCASNCSVSGSYFVNCTWNSTTWSTPVSTYLTN
jgi:hypothetical protein